MNKHSNIHFLTFGIAAVWFVNGFFCKVLNLVPRHSEIVASILNLEKTDAGMVTLAIGLAEMVMALWILSGHEAKLNAQLQMAVVAIMNILEVVLVPDLLLWGRFNAIFALAFIILVYYHEFILNKHTRYVGIL